MRFYCFATLILLFYTTLGYATWVRTPFEGVRPTAMGNAYVALADDKNALWYNPAGLSQQTALTFDLYDFIIGADSIDTLSRLDSALLHGQNSQSLRADKEYARFGFFPTLTGPNWGAGIFYNVQTFLEIEDFTLPQVDLYGASDLGIILGGSLPVTKNFSLGASVRLINRVGVDQTTDTQTFLNSLSTSQTDFQASVYDSISKLFGKGIGYGLNVGMLAKVPLGGKGNRFQWAVTVEDVGQTAFQPVSGSHAPTPIPMSFNTGVAWVYSLSKRSGLNFAFDLRNISSAVPIPKWTHLGAEYRYGPAKVRAGLYQGYLSFGFGLDFDPIHLALSTYAVELGSKFLERYHRWYLVQLSFGLGGLGK